MALGPTTIGLVACGFEGVVDPMAICSPSCRDWSVAMWDWLEVCIRCTVAIELGAGIFPLPCMTELP